MLVWALTLLILDLAIWVVARVLFDANIINNDLEWHQSGILAAVALWIKIWMAALIAKK
jgi:hypothetical protein